MAVTRPAFSTRDAILGAAATAFAARGFAGASVDAIAGQARVNKAMIYYHFKSKHGLYVEVLRDAFRSLVARTSAIAASEASPPAKVEAFIDALNEMACTRPHMPPMMMREVAEGATRLDVETLRLMGGLLGNLGVVLDEGARSGVFRPANPVATYFTLMAPIIFFRASTPVRAALARARVVDERGFNAETFIAHLKRVALSVLATHGLPVPAAAARPRRRRRSTRLGDHA
jgi:TetR/AcrR family transcriptional regulator